VGDRIVVTQGEFATMTGVIVHSDMPRLGHVCVRLEGIRGATMVPFRWTQRAPDPAKVVQPIPAIEEPERDVVSADEITELND
jgi:hypothetical protein